VPLIVALLPRHGKRIVLAGGAAALLILLVLAQTSATILNYRLHLDFAPPWEALFDSLFIRGNWNLLWYGVIATALLGWRQLFARDDAPFTSLIAAGWLFLFIVFAFTNAKEWVETQTTVNRAVLHLAPLMAVWMAVLFHRRFAVAGSGHGDGKPTHPMEPATRSSVVAATSPLQPHSPVPAPAGP
jgi:hypothetical protein